MTSKVNSPRIVVCEDPAEASLHVAGLFANAIVHSPRIVLGLATGGTPVDVYRNWVRMHRGGELDFSQATSFNLDEYIGLGPTHPQSFRFFMQQHLFDQIDIPPARTYVPDGMAIDVEAHAVDYERQIAAAGGIDIQLLGIGSNGHIAFNEPGSTVDSRTRRVALTQATIDANARFFDSPDEVPREAITMGIGTILEARRIVLMATGRGKADAVQRAIEGPADESVPASLLQRHHEVTYVLDDAASSNLAR